MIQTTWWPSASPVTRTWMAAAGESGSGLSRPTSLVLPWGMARRKNQTHEVVIPSPRDLGAPIRRWWEAQKLEDTVDLATLSQALGDLGIITTAHLIRRMCDETTPMGIRDQMALLMAPKLAAEIRGKMPQTKSEAHVLNGDGPETEAPVQQLLANYKITMGEPH